MKIALLSVTEQGRILSQRIANQLAEHEIQRFCFYRHTDETAVSFQNIAQQTEILFPKFDTLIFLCACGIAVRSIASHIQSKASDPAVLVLDDNGKFVISLLSGHLGGANALTEIIAEKLHAVPVITTATDTGKKFSPDSFASANDLIITDLSAAKEIASAVLIGEKIGFYSDYAYQNKPEILIENQNCRTGICITANPERKPFPVTLLLIPRNLVLGIGCKKGTSAGQISETVRKALDSVQIPENRICAVSSIDLKKEESGLLEFCQNRNLPFFTYSAEILASAEGEFTASDFVKHITGTDNICERSAVIHSQGNLILKKYAENGVTVALAECPVMLDFHKRRKLS
ncbi:MAG: cobalt-precorrin 5A hydrolase [Oscillospiraceae bacterium]|nr:cobalt-precorrin 5A hydrolase [Oscillospiraceae bacterium]